MKYNIPIPFDMALHHSLTRLSKDHMPAVVHTWYVVFHGCTHVTKFHGCRHVPILNTQCGRRAKFTSKAALHVALRQGQFPYYNGQFSRVQELEMMQHHADPSRELCSQVLQYDERIHIHFG